MENKRIDEEYYQEQLETRVNGTTKWNIMDQIKKNNGILKILAW